MLGLRNSRACSVWEQSREGGERKVRSEVGGGHTAQGFGCSSGDIRKPLKNFNHRSIRVMIYTLKNQGG